MKIVVTYDIIEEHEDEYDDFYELRDEYKAVSLTKSTYLFNIKISKELFIKRVNSIFKKGDTVCYIFVDDEYELDYDIYG